MSSSRSRSSAASGSSSSSSAGRARRARAMATRWRSPPDRPCTPRASRWPMPSRSSMVVRSAGSRRRPDPALRTTMLDLLGIGHLLARGVHGLSGGERQRVAIARALLARPALLLLDEPLAALERERELDIPVLYVTHAIDEVLRLADHLLLLDAGRVLACGPLNELAVRPDLPLARDQDAGVVVAATVAEYDTRHHLARLDFSKGAARQ